VSFKIIMTTSVTRPCFTTQHQTCKTKTKTDFVWSETGLVLRPTVSDHITVNDTDVVVQQSEVTVCREMMYAHGVGFGGHSRRCTDEFGVLWIWDLCSFDAFV